MLNGRSCRKQDWKWVKSCSSCMQLWCGPFFERFDCVYYLIHRCLQIWYVCYGHYGARILYIFVMDITDRTLYIYILPLIKRIHVSEPRSTLHERSTLLHPQVLLHLLQLGHKREFHHQGRTDRSYRRSRLLSWILPPLLGLDPESMGGRKWCKHLQKESVSKTTWSIPICIPNLLASTSVTHFWVVQFLELGNLKGTHPGVVYELHTNPMVSWDANPIPYPSLSNTKSPHTIPLGS